MKFSFKYLLIILMGLSTGLSSCKDCCEDPTDPDCENYDPCIGKTTVDTYFTFRSGDNGFPPPPQWCLDRISFSDTVLSPAVRFKIPKGNSQSTYEWKIGSDTTIRTADEFELSFENNLNENGWERSIAVTLIIRTPFSSCLANPEDTLIFVTRNLFFTQKSSGIFRDDIGADKSFKGYFDSEPEKEVILKTYYNRTFDFRGETPGHWLIVGLPTVDTLMLPEGGCGYLSGCGSYVHSYYRWERTSVCSWVELTKYITDFEILQDYSRDKVTLRFRSTVPGHEFYEVFIGEEV